MKHTIDDVFIGYENMKPKKLLPTQIAGVAQSSLARNSDPTSDDGDTNKHMNFIISSTLASN